MHKQDVYKKNKAVLHIGDIAAYIIKQLIYEMNSPAFCWSQSVWSLPKGNLRGFKIVACYTSTGGTEQRMTIVFHLILKTFLCIVEKCTVVKETKKFKQSYLLWETAKKYNVIVYSITYISEDLIYFINHKGCALELHLLKIAVTIVRTMRISIIVF